MGRKDTYEVYKNIEDLDKEEWVDIKPDYAYWFSKDNWNLPESAALLIGLNPKAILNHFDKNDIDSWHEILDITNAFVDIQLEEYSLNYNGWHRQFMSAFDNLLHDYQHGDLRLSECYPYFTPQFILQWAYDNNCPMHHLLTEYLEEEKIELTFSKHSAILNMFEIYAKKEIWYLSEAARLLLGIDPEAGLFQLSKIQNLTRHLNPNQLMTKRDEVWEVMDLAIQSWQVQKLEIIDNDELLSGSYSLHDNSIKVESKKFIEWAIKKGFTPPKQLLHLMGFGNLATSEVRKPKNYTTPYIELIFEAIEALKINNENQPAKKTITEWLKNRDPQLSDREASYIATFVRTPDMKKGGYYKGNN